ncbi:Hypothetical predicted protein [Olea europaea subsp. europaea]|uniref:Uncharacterized protein n=1 Tax=Olea europaea subsp. europaea TaxID=158383 RepID=A0A8S0V716_OLEEU|nr:Hypothetical predicted protein [Olea europaea subsp. europaea]
MDALVRFSKLETANADLARSLAAAQKNSEIELVASKGVEFELKMLEAEYSFVTNRVERLQEKVAYFIFY